MNKELKYQLAPQEAIKFNYKLIELFIIKILKVKSFMITDKSKVSDMRSNVSSQGKPISDTEWEFTYTLYKRSDKPLHEQTEEERLKNARVVTHKVPTEDVSFDDKIIAETKTLFGSELELEDLKGTFVNLGLKLSKGLSAEKRADLEKMHQQLINELAD